MALVIRQKQLQALSSVTYQETARSMAKSAAAAFPEQVTGMSPRDVELLVLRGLERAKRYGLEMEKDLAWFVYLMFRFGEHFDTDPECWWAGMYLRQVRSEPGAFERLVQVAGQFEHESRGLAAGK